MLCDQPKSDALSKAFLVSPKWCSFVSLLESRRYLRRVVVLQVLGSFMAVIAAVMASSKAPPLSRTWVPVRFSFDSETSEFKNWDHLMNLTHTVYRHFKNVFPPLLRALSVTLPAHDESFWNRSNGSNTAKMQHSGPSNCPGIKAEHAQIMNSEGWWDLVYFRSIETTLSFNHLSYARTLQEWNISTQHKQSV